VTVLKPWHLTNKTLAILECASWVMVISTRLFTLIKNINLVTLETRNSDCCILFNESQIPFYSANKQRFLNPPFVAPHLSAGRRCHIHMY